MALAPLAHLPEVNDFHAARVISAAASPVCLFVEYPILAPVLTKMGREQLRRVIDRHDHRNIFVRLKGEENPEFVSRHVGNYPFPRPIVVVYVRGREFDRWRELSRRETLLGILKRAGSEARRTP